MFLIQEHFIMHVLTTQLQVDGKHVELPPLEGIVILNILSWGSGANPWGPEKDDNFSKPNHWDGMLEVVGVTGVVHLGQIQSGLRSAMRIAQGGKNNFLSCIPSYCYYQTSVTV